MSLLYLLIFPQTIPDIQHDRMFRADKFVEVGHVFFLQAVTHFAFFSHLVFIFQFILNLQSLLKLLIYSTVSYVGTYVRVLYSIINCDTQKKERKGHITFWNMPALARKGLTFS